MSTPFDFEYDVHFQRHGQGAPKGLRAGPAPEVPAERHGGIARVARLMALAIRFEELVRTGTVSAVVVIVVRLPGRSAELRFQPRDLGEHP